MCQLFERSAILLLLEHELLRLSVPTETLARSHEQMHAKREPTGAGDGRYRPEAGRAAVDFAAGQSAQQGRRRGELLHFALRIEETNLD